MNLGGYLTRSSMFWPEHEALVCADRRWTYRELEARTNRLASALIARGLRTGEVAGTLAWNRGELVEAEMALSKAGLLRAPINARLATGEVAHVLADARVRVLFVDADDAERARTAVAESGADCLLVGYDAEAPGDLPYADLLAAGSDDPVAVEAGEDDPAVLHFTSGSTGRLKAAVQTNGNRLANMRKRIMAPDGAPTLGHRYLAPGPITHASGMGILACLARGAAVHVLPRFDAESFLGTVERERITSTFLVPTMLNLVLAHPGAGRYDLSSLTCVRVGGAPVAPQRLRDAVALFGPVVAQGYGQAETTSGVTVLSSDDVLRGVNEDPQILLSCGRAVFDTEVRVIDEAGHPVPNGSMGEVVVRGPDCVRRYWNEPELSAEMNRGGWVHTGDLGYLREDGYLFIVDRKKDMIISGGFNVYCTEVEAVLYEHPGVHEACVIGVPDERWGEAVKAVVVPAPRTSPTGQEIIEFCATRLARMKKPQTVDFVAELPRNRNGKIDRRTVREPYWAGTDRRVH